MTTHPALSLRPLTEREVQPRGRLRQYFVTHPRVTDTAVALVVAFSQVGVTTGDVSDAPRPWALVAAAVVTVAVWFRRRFPLAVLAAVGAVMAAALFVAPGSLVGELGFPVAVYAVARYRSPTAAWAGMGTSLVACVAVVVLYAAGWHAAPTSPGARRSSGWSATDPSFVAGAGSVALLVVLGLLGLALGVQAHGRHQHVVELVRRTAELVAAGEQNARLVSMQERSRIAREMHDVVAHSLSVMIALADGARAAAPKSPQAAAEALDLLAETGRTALTDMRRMLGVLRDGETLMSPQPTTDDDVAGLVEVFGRAGLAVRLRADPLPDHPGLRLAVFRVAQEALTNVLRHARGATVADVEVRVAGGTVEVTVRDDGGPVPSGDGHGGKGLVGMRERAAVYAGEVEAGPVAGGWQVRATLTVPEADPSVVTWVLPS